MSKLCECGCGKEVTHEINRFIHNHHKSMLGKHHSKETKLKMSNSQGSEEVKEKKINTCRKNWNTDFPMQSKEVQEKSENTMIKNHGTKYAMQCKEVQEKFKQTSQKHFHTNYPMQCKEVQEKTLQTNKDRYDGIGFASPILFQKTQDTIQKLYGVDNYSKTSKFREFARGKLIEDIKSGLKDGESFSPREGFQEEECFTEIQKYTKYELLKRQKLINLFPDRYIKELNIIIEFYELWHNNTWCKKRDLIRQKELEDRLNCKFFIIHEKDWKENKEKVIKEFTLLIDNCS